MRSEGEPVYFERIVVAEDVLKDGERDLFLEVASQKGQELLSELDTFLTHLPPSDANLTGKKYGLGMYFFEEDAANGPAIRSPKVAQTAERSGKPGAVEEIDVLAPRRRKD
jgi:hypothetical protein